MAFTPVEQSMLEIRKEGNTTIMRKCEAQSTLARVCAQASDPEYGRHLPQAGSGCRIMERQGMPSIATVTDIVPSSATVTDMRP